MKRVLIGAVVVALVIGGQWLYMQSLLSKLEVARERADLARRRGDVKNIMVACVVYAENHAGHFPRNSAQFAEIYGTDYWQFTNILSRLEIAKPDARLTDDPNTIVLREQTPDSKNRRASGYVDGRTEVVDADGHPVRP
jgi:hypothetical protein